PGLRGRSRHVQAVTAAARDLRPERPHPVREAMRPGPALVADRVARPLLDRRVRGGSAPGVEAQAAGLVQELVAGTPDADRRPVLGLDVGAGLLDDGLSGSPVRAGRLQAHGRSGPGDLNENLVVAGRAGAGTGG